MAEASNDQINPSVRLDTPTPQLHQEDEAQESSSTTPKNDRLGAASLRDNVYRGSYQRSIRSLAGIRNFSNLSRQSVSQIHLESLLAGADTKLDTFDIDELRDGFFDAMYVCSTKQDKEAMHAKAVESLPILYQKSRQQPVWGSIKEEWTSLILAVKEICATRSGIKLFKSCLGVLLAYIICLIPASRAWLGKYSYIMVISAIFNHPGRSIGSQIDGALMTSFGMGLGLAWGSLTLFASTSTNLEEVWKRSIVATFLVILFTFSISWIRCVFPHLYQGVIAAGIAVFYICLANTSEGLEARMVSSFAIPWLLGQVLCLVVSSLVFPSAGSRPLAISFHSCLETVEARLMFYDLSTQSAIKLRLAWHLVNLSTAVRDFTIDFSVSRYHPEDVRTLRNLLQGVIRGSLTMRAPPPVFRRSLAQNQSKKSMDPLLSPLTHIGEPSDPIQMVQDTLETPCRNLQLAFKEAIRRVDAVLMDLSEHRKYLGPSMKISTNVTEIIAIVKQRVFEFDSADNSMGDNPKMPKIHIKHPEVVDILLFAHCLRQATDKIIQLLEHCAHMQKRGAHLRVNLPSYGLKKSLLRTNAQVRHDRGGLSATVYFRAKAQIDETIHELQGREFFPQGYQERTRDSSDEHAHVQESGPSDAESHVPGVEEQGDRRATLRYRLWTVIHRNQGFESRFALKMTLVTALCCIPAWLPVSRTWYDENESWWIVVTIWMLMHPRAGDNVQDLFVRVSSTVIGAVWGGMSLAAGKGNIYILTVMGAVLFIPMLYRYTQSGRPRSGFIGCVSFVVVSLGNVTTYDRYSTLHLAWTRGSAFVAGVVAAVIVNWVLWPFIARHELRKSLSAMLLHSAILYRGIISKYVYYTEGNEPGPEDVARSEMLEGKLREGFVRVRELMDLTRHEIRLRAPFDPVPYSALLQSLEAFFEHLIQVRQCSLYFHPHMLAGTEKGADDALLTLRRDAASSILMNLYTLASALRSDRPVPCYLPSAAAARQRLLDRMAALTDHEGITSRTGEEGKKRWADVYQEAYSAALTDIVEELQVLEYWTKEICGEVGFDVDV